MDIPQQQVENTKEREMQQSNKQKKKDEMKDGLYRIHEMQGVITINKYPPVAADPSKGNHGEPWG